VTEEGGQYDAGAVFKLAPKGSSWTESVIYNFKGADNDGGTPLAGLVRDSDGILYGTTSAGGTFTLYCANGCGTVFKLTETSGGGWQEKVLYRFAGALDGSEPQAPLILDSTGNLYGTATYSGSGAEGTVFKIKP
jgi:uncharacterized repeat protein (TIGR03803 family)